MEGKRRQGRGGHFRQRSQPDTATLGLEWAGQNRVGLSEDMDATCRRLSVASKDAAFGAAAAAETEGAGTTSGKGMLRQGMFDTGLRKYLARNITVNNYF